MRITVLGSGCASCRRLEENAAKAAAELGLKSGVEKITDIERIAEFGVMSLPALAINGEVVLSGSVPSAKEIKEILGDYI